MKKYSIDRIRRFNIVDAFIHFGERQSNIKYWEPLFTLQLQRWGFGRSGASTMFKWGEHGHNWVKLHPTEEEEKLAPDVVLNMFYAEVDYCSDRMSLDRLFRCNWLYHLYLNRCRALKKTAD